MKPVKPGQACGLCGRSIGRVYTPPYIPRADDAFRAWVEAFVHNINLAPARYMMTSAEADDLQHKLAVFLHAYNLATNELTRTKQTIADKDDARSILESSCRDQAAFIRVNKGITDGDKIAVGVPPQNVARNKRRCPDTPPLLQYAGSLPGMDQLYFHDSSSTSKSKPYGAERLELWVAYTFPGDGPAKKDDAKPVGSFKKSKMLVETDLEAEARGGRPTYFARWAGFDGAVGPWSLPLNTMIAAREARAKKASAAVEAKPDASDAAMKLAA